MMFEQFDERHTKHYEASQEYCNRCGREFRHPDEPFEVDTCDRYVCRDCYYDYYRMCYRCLRVLDPYDLIPLDDDMFVCKECFGRIVEDAKREV